MELQKAIQLIQETAVRAAGPHEVVGGKRHVTTLFANGEYAAFEHDRPPRRHSACDIPTLLAKTTDRSTIWHQGDRVIAVLDDSDASHREDFVELKLDPSDKWTALADAGRPREHAEFVRWLYENLRDELNEASPGLLGVLRNLRFRTVDDEEKSIKHGRESMGRSIDSEITGAEAIPETIKLQIRRWSSIDYYACVECVVRLDTHARTLCVKPLADELRRAEHAAQDWLGDMLANQADCPVHYGAP